MPKHNWFQCFVTLVRSISDAQPYFALPKPVVGLPCCNVHCKAYLHLDGVADSFNPFLCLSQQRSSNRSLRQCDSKGSLLICCPRDEMGAPLLQGSDAASGLAAVALRLAVLQRPAGYRGTMRTAYHEQYNTLKLHYAWAISLVHDCRSVQQGCRTVEFLFGMLQLQRRDGTATGENSWPQCWVHQMRVPRPSDSTIEVVDTRWNKRTPITCLYRTQ